LRALTCQNTPEFHNRTTSTLIKFQCILAQ
jgi:hypothetical protein